jgi:hypothetical protein
MEGGRAQRAIARLVAVPPGAGVAGSQQQAMASVDMRRRFDQFLNENQVRRSPGDREALFRQFLERQKQQAQTH